MTKRPGITGTLFFIIGKGNGSLRAPFDKLRAGSAQGDNLPKQIQNIVAGSPYLVINTRCFVSIYHPTNQSAPAGWGSIHFYWQ